MNSNSGHQVPRIYGHSNHPMLELSDSDLDLNFFSSILADPTLTINVGFFTTPPQGNPTPHPPRHLSTNRILRSGWSCVLDFSHQLHPLFPLGKMNLECHRFGITLFLGMTCFFFTGSLHTAAQAVHCSTEVLSMRSVSCVWS